MLSKETLKNGMSICYEKTVCKEIKELTHSEMGVFIQAFFDLSNKAHEIQDEAPRNSEIVTRHPVGTILNALDNYKRLVELDYYATHYSNRLGSKRSDKFKSGGQVYVIEFDDGSIKIGQSVCADARVRNISGGNQAKTLRTFFSQRSHEYITLEQDCHKKFASLRLGGEFFTTRFEDAVAFIEEQM